MSTRKKISIAATSAFLLFFSWMQLRLVSTAFYIDANNSIHTSLEGYGDTPYHLTQITKFAFGSFNLSEPIYLGAKLSYPFVINLVSGLLLRMTGWWSFSVLMPIYVLALANIFLVFFIYKKILRNTGLAIASFLLFFLGPGVTGFSYVKNALASHQSIVGMFQAMAKSNVSAIVKLDAVYPMQNVDFGSPLTLVFIHQRTFFLGMFGLLLFTWLLLKLRDTDNKKYSICAGIVLGLLPLWHTHAFVAAGGMLIIVILMNMKRERREVLKCLCYTLAIGILVAVPQLYFLLSGKKTLIGTAEFAKFRFGWMSEPGFGSMQFPYGSHWWGNLLSYLNFQWLNFGLALPLFALFLTLFFFFRKKMFGNIRTAKTDGKKMPLQETLTLFSLTAVGLFAANQLIKFQPWDFDNNKILVYCLFFASPFIIWSLHRLFRKFPRFAAVAVTLFVAFSIFSGMVDALPRVMTAKADLPVIFTSESEQLASYVRAHIAENDLILTGTTHLNPVSSLAGRQSLEGYPGWLWTHGIDYSARDAAIRHFYSSPTLSDPLLSMYNIRYILLDDDTRSNFGATTATFDQLLPRAYESGQYVLYGPIR